MSMNVYIPDSTKIVHTTSVDFMTRSTIGRVIHLIQYDNSIPIIEVKLYSNGSPYSVPENLDVNVRVKKPDGNALYNPVLGCNSDRTAVYVEATLQFCIADGDIYAVIELTDNTVVAASGYFNVTIDKNPVSTDDVMSSSEAKSIQQFVSESKSWAVGDTGTREGEDTDNSKYYASQASEAAINAKKSEAVLKNAQEIIDSYQNESKSWAVGDTGTREGEDTDNSKYYASQASIKSKDASDYASAAAKSASDANTDAKKIEDLLAENVPEVYIDWETGNLMYSGGRLTLWTDEDGFLVWGED